jgi:hypothetical protein
MSVVNREPTPEAGVGFCGLAPRRTYKQSAATTCLQESSTTARQVITHFSTSRSTASACSCDVPTGQSTHGRLLGQQH